MIGPLNCNFFTAVEIATKISTVGERSYVFEEKIQDEYFPQGQIFYYIAHAEGMRDRLDDADPDSTVKTMGCAMDGEWLNIDQVHARKNWIAGL